MIDWSGGYNRLLKAACALLSAVVLGAGALPALAVESDAATHTVFLPTVASSTNSVNDGPTMGESVGDDVPWLASYWNNRALVGESVLVREEAHIDYDWGQGSPDPVVNSDGFSARWTKSLDLPEGDYRFFVTVDDGARVFVDGDLIIDEWADGAARTFTADRELDGGSHSLRVEFYENGGAAEMRFRVESTSVEPTDRWRGEYFNNRDLVGEPELIRDDEEIDFKWGTGSPDARINSDNFSVRWTRAIDFDEGRYRFKVETDDGARLYIDGKLVISEWRVQIEQEYDYEVSLDEGVHTVRLEYFEAEGTAEVELDIDRVGDGDEDNDGDEDDPTSSHQLVGNIITCSPPNPPNNASVRIYRLEDGEWVRIARRGIGSLSSTGFIKIDGIPIDPEYNNDGHPYWVEIWFDGVITESIGNTSRGEVEWRVFPGIDNFTPWQCARP